MTVLKFELILAISKPCMNQIQTAPLEVNMNPLFFFFFLIRDLYSIRLSGIVLGMTVAGIISELPLTIIRSY